MIVHKVLDMKKPHLHAAFVTMPLMLVTKSTAGSEFSARTPEATDKGRDGAPGDQPTVRLPCQTILAITPKAQAHSVLYRAEAL